MSITWALLPIQVSKYKNIYNYLQLIFLITCLFFRLFDHGATSIKRRLFRHRALEVKPLISETLNKNNLASFSKILYSLAKSIEPRYYISWQN